MGVCNCDINQFANIKALRSPFIPVLLFRDFDSMSVHRMNDFMDTTSSQKEPKNSEPPKNSGSKSRMIYGFSIFFLFTACTCAGPVFMASFISLVCAGLIREVWIFMKDRLHGSLLSKVPKDSLNDTALTREKVINEFLRNVKLEFSVLHFIAGFWHAASFIQNCNLLNVSVTPKYLYNASLPFLSCYSEVLIKSMLFLIGQYNFLTCLLYITYILLCIRNLHISISNDVIFVHHMLAIGTQHFSAVTTIIHAVHIKFPFIFGCFWTFMVLCNVAFNDCWAYFIGRNFGRHQLSKISPKKTIEGYIGSGIMTISAAIIFVYLVRLCKPEITELPKLVCSNTRNGNFRSDGNVAPASSWSPFTHIFVISVFASILSPIIGLIFSAIKRAFKKQDFANTLGPHGGFLDRFDCTTTTTLFAYCYFHFISEFTFP